MSDYYQVQVKKNDTWLAFGSACRTLAEANKIFLGFFTGLYVQSDDYSAIRIGSVWKTPDDVWRVKDIIQYKDLPRD